MPYYRLYFLDHRGRFGLLDAYPAEDDAAAIRQAEVHREAGKELWCGGRRVKQWSEGRAA